MGNLETNGSEETEPKTPEAQKMTTYKQYKEFALEFMSHFDKHGDRDKAFEEMGNHMQEAAAPGLIREFVEQSLTDEDPQIRYFAFIMLPFRFDEKFHFSALQKLRSDEDPKNRQEALSRILNWTNGSELAADVKEALESGDEQLQIKAVHKIREVPTENVTLLLKNALANESSSVRMLAADLIHRAPEEDRTGFILDALDDTSFSVNLTAAISIFAAPENDRKDLIKKALTHKEEAVARAAYDSINSVPSWNDQIGLKQGAPGHLKLLFESNTLGKAWWN